ncbi:hypothetical protein Tco_0269647 [Tanacetum coccineum]
MNGEEPPEEAHDKSVESNEVLTENQPQGTNCLPIVKMDDPNITMEEYIRLEEEKARRRGKVYNWETSTYGKIRDNEDVHDLGSIETEFPAIVFNDTLTSEAALSCEPTVSIRRILGNGYGVSTSCTVLGPRERNIDEYWWRIYKSRNLEVLES